MLRSIVKRSQPDDDEEQIEVQSRDVNHESTDVKVDRWIFLFQFASLQTCLVCCCFLFVDMFELQ